MTEYEEIVNELIDILNGPQSPTNSIAHKGNVVELVEEILDEYNNAVETLRDINARTDY